MAADLDGAGVRQHNRPMGTHGEDTYVQLVNRLFCKPDAPYGPYVLRGDPEVVVPNVLIRARVHRPGDLADRYEISLFLGIHGFAGELWEHELRSLLRLEALNHPALPEIKGGSFRAADGVAFIMTRDHGQPLRHDLAVQWARDHPIEALEQFSVLLDALSQLHGARLLHRNLTMGALRAVQPDDSSQVNVQLTRFEMSTLIGNLVRRVSRREEAQARDLIRRLYLTPPEGVEEARHLAYLAPETHDYLLSDRAASRRDWETTDVFGMGVVGWEWFCGPIPEVLPEEYAAVSAAEGPAKAIALARLHEAMRRHLTRKTDLPRPLAELLRRLLHSAPESRDTSFEALRYLEQHWEGIRGVWDLDDEQKPYLVAFMPGKSEETIYNKRKWISRTPADPAGRDELKLFLEQELRCAELVWSSTGAVGYATDDLDKLEEAEWVLIGERAVWFCAYLYDEDLLSRRRGKRHEDTLVIKYFKERNYAQELVNARPRRRVGRLELVPFYPGQSLREVRAGRPSWRKLTDSVRKVGRRNPEDADFLRSLDFLLEYERVELDARKYPFIRIDEGEQPGTAILRHDHKRDDERRHRSPLLTAYSADGRRRPPLGDFVERLSTEDDFIRLDVVSGTRPHFHGSCKTVDLVERKDADTIVVRPRGDTVVPKVGWLRPSEDGGSEPQLIRKVRARTALESQAALIRNLRDPQAFDLGRGRWDADNDERLEGEAPDRIRDMLALQPFYALQGPPGTGKTTVAAHAVRRYLKAEPGARVLVSAQSNYALDNLAARLIKELPEETLILRETPAGAKDEDTVKDPVVLEHTLRRLTQRVAENVELELTAMLDPDKLSEADRRRLKKRSGWFPPRLDEKERALAEEWLRSVQSNKIELTDRIRSGASVVLATCSISSTITETVRDPSDMFDWVILEEAAKAWPTEVIIPLVLGTRWTLIGDHRQLGAYREREVSQFLESLSDHADDDVRRHFEDRKSRLRALKLFASLFEEGSPDANSSPARRRVSPLGRLELQFRMHPIIAQPVGRAFYRLQPEQRDEDGLPVSFLRTHGATAEIDHGVSRPYFLKNSPLVWLDTAGMEQCREEPFWYNLGEVELIEKLVQQMDPPPLPPGVPAEEDGGLVILTPYLAQKKRLESRGLLARRVHTVHSYQGREADRVIVSLVRSTRLGNTVASNVGHVGQDEVINVLLSRARRLLVLVGNLEHLATCGGESWDIVIRTIKRYGRIEPARILEE